MQHTKWYPGLELSRNSDVAGAEECPCTPGCAKQLHTSMLLAGKLQHFHCTIYLPFRDTKLEDWVWHLLTLGVCWYDPSATLYTERRGERHPALLLWDVVMIGCWRVILSHRGHSKLPLASFPLACFLISFWSPYLLLRGPLRTYRHYLRAPTNSKDKQVAASEGPLSLRGPWRPFSFDSGLQSWPPQPHPYWPSSSL